jgi:hypothetical protein
VVCTYHKQPEKAKFHVLLNSKPSTIDTFQYSIKRNSERDNADGEVDCTMMLLPPRNGSLNIACGLKTG